MCTTSFDETSGVPSTFCCRCSVRIHNRCKDKWFSGTTHDGEQPRHGNPCPSCSENDELYGRSPDFWGGRGRRQQYIEQNKIVKCEYIMPGVVEITTGWFWTSSKRYRKPHWVGQLPPLPRRRRQNHSRGWCSLESKRRQSASETCREFREEEYKL